MSNLDRLIRRAVAVAAGTGPLLVGRAGWAQAAAADAPAADDLALAVLAVVALVSAGAALVYRRRLGLARAEAARREGDARRVHEIAAVSPDQFYCWDLASGAEEASPGLSSVVGLPRGRRPGFADVQALFSADDAARLGEAVRELRETGKGFELALKSDHEDRILRTTGTAAGFAAGRPAVAVLWLRDDTRKVREEARLEGEIARLRRLLDFLPIPVWRRGRDLGLDYVNNAYLAAVEAPAATPPETLRELTAGAVGEHGRALARQAQESRERLTRQQHVVIAGARRLVQVSEGPLGEDGRTAGFALDHTDIEEVRAELSRHIAGHEEVLHRLGTAVAIYDADQRLRFFNHAFVQLWGIEESWLRTEPRMGDVLEALRDRRRLPEAADFPAFKAAQLNYFTSLLDPREEMMHLPDGTALRTLTTPHPFGGLLLTWEDVTDALRLERSYNTLIAVQRETLDNLYEGVAVIGADGRLQLSNPAFGRMWQLPDAELAAKPHIADIVERMRDFIEEGADWPAQKEQTIGLLTDRAGHTGRLERTDGSVLDFATVPLPDGAMLLSYLDVSDSVKVQRALGERNEALETADRLKSEFIANVSYELRTPLNTIIGFSEILTGRYFGELNDRQVEYAQGILDSSHRLLSLINDILDLAMIESGRMVLELGATDIRQVLSSVIALSREPMQKKRQTVDFDCPEDVGSIVADERRLKQAVFSIMSNAIKFTPEGGHIAVRARRAGDELELSVTDNGIGISEADRSRVFQRFERGDTPEARRSGVGLGLSLVKSFIELHGGRVTLESAPGAGTTVTCVLPAREAAAAPELKVGTG